LLRFNLAVFFDPRATVFGGNPLSLLLRIEAADYEQGNREQYCECQFEGMSVPIFRNGY
jgi:hypothetical protein